VNDDYVPARRRVERTRGGAGALKPCGEEHPAVRGARERELGDGFGNRRSSEQFRDQVVSPLFERRREGQLGTTPDGAKETREKARSTWRSSHEEPAFLWDV